MKETDTTEDLEGAQVKETSAPQNTPVNTGETAGGMPEVCPDWAPDIEARTSAAEPFGAVSAVTAALCRCGAGPHPELEGRCAAGHVGQGNGLALVVGATSRAFWQAHDDTRREIRQAVIADAGHTPDDAPQALRLAAESIAQATLIRDSTYLRLAEAGGPLAASGRVRRAFHAWVQASDRLERYLRLVGLRRVPRPVDPLEAVRAAVREANRS